MTREPPNQRLPSPPGRIEERVRNARDTLPGQRDALAPHTLRPVPPEPQGDENREPTSAPKPPP